MPEKIAITEEMGVQKEWYKEARTLKSVDQLRSFIIHLFEDYAHDYGTVCHAVAASALAAAWTANRQEGARGGITGFQAGAVMWEFIRYWNPNGADENSPMRLVDYGNMLFPQYDHHFQKTISTDTWKYLQKKASENLKNAESDPVHPDVKAHWEKITAGKIPFGYSLKED